MRIIKNQKSDIFDSYLEIMNQFNKKRSQDESGGFTKEALGNILTDVGLGLARTSGAAAKLLGDGSGAIARSAARMGIESGDDAAKIMQKLDDAYKTGKDVDGKAFGKASINKVRTALFHGAVM